MNDMLRLEAQPTLISVRSAQLGPADASKLVIRRKYMQKNVNKNHRMQK